jgi:hypothetical protein
VRAGPSEWLFQPLLQLFNRDRISHGGDGSRWQLRFVVRIVKNFVDYLECVATTKDLRGQPPLPGIRRGTPITSYSSPFPALSLLLLLSL